MFVGGSNNIQMDSQPYEMANVESQASSFSGVGQLENTLVKHMKSSGVGHYDN